MSGDSRNRNKGFEEGKDIAHGFPKAVGDGETGVGVAVCVAVGVEVLV